MRPQLGPKSRLLLDLLLTTGMNLIEFGVDPTRALWRGGWNDDQQIKRQLRRMRDEGLIDCDDSSSRSEWVVSVTALGRERLSHGIDPQEQWARPWDGRWRFVIFDLPEAARARRRELSIWLREKRFGRLQGSAWVTPTFPKSWSREIAQLPLRPAEVSFVVGAPFDRSSDATFAATAWKFSVINRAYREFLDFLEAPSALATEEWLTIESRLWRRAFAADPFLPDRLLPKGYLGKEAFAARRRAYLGRLED